MSDAILRGEKAKLLNSIGTEQSWGWSPAIDFVRLLDERAKAAAGGSAATVHPDNAGMCIPSTAKADGESATTREPPATCAGGVDSEETSSRTDTQEAVSILLAGAGDIRHVLRTVASLRAREEAYSAAVDGDSNSTQHATKPTQEYHFYIYEPNLRQHCRHLFFLQWLLDSMFSLEELEERVLMFLEVFGNTLVREMTAAQSRGVAQRLVKGLVKESGDLMALVSFAEMKQKEKDFVEEQLVFWTKDAIQPDIETQWSKRVRQEMGDRFDNRDNLIDWDFVFHLSEYTNLLKSPEYRVWRNSGVAYDICHINPRKEFSYVYSKPNKSLCYYSRTGDGTYCGDVKNGPFFALGVATENTHLWHRSADGTCKYGNGVVAMHNVRAWLFTLMTGRTWPWADHKFAWDDPACYNYLPPGTPSSVEYKAAFPKVKFHFIGLDFDRFLLRCRSGRSPRRMDAAFVGTSCTHLLSRQFFSEAVSPEGVVVAETAKFVVDAEDAGKEAFAERITSLAHESGWKPQSQLTEFLAGGRPEAVKPSTSPTTAQVAAQKRYGYPSQIALTRSA